MIELTQDKFAIVDDDDFAFLNFWKWRFSNNGYAVRNSAMIGGVRGNIISMHRLIIGTPKDMQTDHMNGNRLDNRRSNLRVCTGNQNQWNQHKTHGTSKFKGVYWFKQACKWRAKIWKENKCIHIGIFSNEYDAAKAYNIKATELFGNFACLNEV